MRALAASIVINAALLGLLGWLGGSPPASHRAQPIEIEVIDSRVADPPAPAAPAAASAPGGGREGRATTPHRAAPRARPAPSNPWSTMTVSYETGGGRGTGTGAGDGDEIGFGAGGQIIYAPAIPRPPPPRPPAAAPSLGRPAKLLQPAREEEIDEESLFIARITVDEDGDVVGAHMLRTRPGSRGEVAANAIWRFRYAPALDPSGRPVRSTFDQRFQIR